MDWTQTLTIIVSIFGLFLVAIPYLISRMDANQKENNAKFEVMLNRIDANQKESSNKFEAMNGRFNGLENRLTAIEVEVKNINQRLTTIENCVMPRKVFEFKHHDKPEEEEPKEN